MTTKETAVITRVTALQTRLGRPSPYGVQWLLNGQRKTEYFTTEADRDRKVRELQRDAQSGAVFFRLTAREAADYRLFRQAIGDTPWEEVVAGWRAHTTARQNDNCPVTAEEALPHYLKHVAGRVAAGDLTPAAASHRRTKARMFCAAHAGVRLDAFTTDEVEDWLKGLGFTSGGTFNSYLKNIADFFKLFASRDTPLGRERQLAANPCDGIERKSEAVEAEVTILPVEDTRTLFRFALKHYPQALPRLALEAFAGLRFSTAQRLHESDINFEDRGISLPADTNKRQRFFHLDQLPENLWPWLELGGGWGMNASQWMHLKTRLFAEAKVAHPRNVLRHSFATYHVAAYKNPGLTATILTHANQRKLWGVYNGRAKQADGLAYFAITPLSVLPRRGRGAVRPRRPGSPRTSPAHGTESAPAGQTPSPPAVESFASLPPA